MLYDDICKDTQKESNKITDKQTRYLEILSAFEKYPKMTARECMEALNYQDMNAVRPRLTELKDMGKIKANDIKYDPVTKRNVAVFERVV